MPEWPRKRQVGLGLLDATLAKTDPERAGLRYRRKATDLMYQVIETSLTDDLRDLIRG